MESTNALTGNAFQRTSLLVIEDTDDQWLLTRYCLQQVLPGIIIDRVTSPHRAIEFISKRVDRKQLLPGLILQNLFMPKAQDGLTSLDLLQEYMDQEDFPQIPVVVSSNSTDPVDIARCYQRGAYLYLVKTPDLDQRIEAYRVLRLFWQQNNR